MTDTVLARVAALKTAQTTELKQQWRELFGTEPPPYNRRFLESRLAYRIHTLMRLPLHIHAADIYAQQFDLGQRGLLDLLDSENELFLARSNLVTATFTETFAVYRVLAVIGMMLDTLDIDRPKEAINIYRKPTPPEYPATPVNARR